MRQCVQKLFIVLALALVVSAVSSCHTKRAITSNRPSSNKGIHSGKLIIEKGDNTQLYQEINKWIGTPYAAGAHTMGQGTDCSGFVMEVYKTVFHINLERNSKRMCEKNCVMIKQDELKEGDLVFFNTGGSNGSINHVGIYLKAGKFAHASSSRGVMISDMSQAYYIKHFIVAGRVLQP